MWFFPKLYIRKGEYYINDNSIFSLGLFELLKKSRAYENAEVLKQLWMNDYSLLDAEVKEASDRKIIFEIGDIKLYRIGFDKYAQGFDWQNKEFSIISSNEKFSELLLHYLRKEHIQDIQSIKGTRVQLIDGQSAGICGFVIDYFIGTEEVMEINTVAELAERWDEYCKDMFQGL